MHARAGCSTWPAGGRAGQHRPAIALYDRAISAPSLNRVIGRRLPARPALKRSGELYEAKGDRAKAADRYRRFVELWKDADPELQPGVREVRARWPAWPRSPAPDRSACCSTIAHLLARLVAFDTTSHASNLPLADFLAEYLDRPGVRIDRNPSADGAKTNLVVAVGPEADGPRAA